MYINYPNDVFVGRNQACKLIDKPDYAFMNDFESLFGLTNDDIKHVQNFVFAFHPRQNLKLYYLSSCQRP